MANFFKYVYRTAFMMAAMLHLSLGVADVAFDIPATPVQEGETINMQCTVTEKSPYQVFIMRQGIEENRQFLVIGDRAVAVLPNNLMIEISNDVMNDMFVVTLTLTANRTDAQTYTCWIGLNSNDNEVVASDSGNLRVNYLPNVIYPICDISGPNKGLTRLAGSNIIMDCTSEIGNPPVAPQWTGPGNSRVPSIDSASKTLTTSRIIVTLGNSHDGATFTCGLLRSPDRTCSIGPIQISGSIPSGGSSETSYNPGMVVALAILAVVIVIVVVVIVIAVLVKCGQCACNNCNNPPQNDETDSRDIEMQVHIQKPKKAKKKTKKTKNNNKEDLKYEIAHVPMTDLPSNQESRSENAYAYAQDIEKETSITNGSLTVTTKGKDYPPPPLYPSLDIEDAASEKPNDIKVVMDDELSISSDSSDNSSLNMPIPSEVGEVESDPVVEDVTAE